MRPFDLYILLDPAMILPLRPYRVWKGEQKIELMARSVSEALITAEELLGAPPDGITLLYDWEDEERSNN